MPQGARYAQSDTPNLFDDIDSFYTYIIDILLVYLIGAWDGYIKYHLWYKICGLFWMILPYIFQDM